MNYSVFLAGKWSFDSSQRVPAMEAARIFEKLVQWTLYPSEVNGESEGDPFAAIRYHETTESK